MNKRSPWQNYGGFAMVALVIVLVLTLEKGTLQAADLLTLIPVIFLAFNFEKKDKTNGTS